MKDKHLPASTGDLGQQVLQIEATYISERGRYDAHDIVGKYRTDTDVISRVAHITPYTGVYLKERDVHQQGSRRSNSQPWWAYRGKLREVIWAQATVRWRLTDSRLLDR